MKEKKKTTSPRANRKSYLTEQVEVESVFNLVCMFLDISKTGQPLFFLGCIQNSSSGLFFFPTLTVERYYT